MSCDRIKPINPYFSKNHFIYNLFRTNRRHSLAVYNEKNEIAGCAQKSRLIHFAICSTLDHLGESRREAIEIIGVHFRQPCLYGIWGVSTKKAFPLGTLRQRRFTSKTGLAYGGKALSWSLRRLFSTSMVRHTILVRRETHLSYST